MLPSVPLRGSESGWEVLPVSGEHLLLNTSTHPQQKFNADYDLSAREGADTLAFLSLLEEKLLPVLVSDYLESGSRSPP